MVSLVNEVAYLFEFIVHGNTCFCPDKTPYIICSDYYYSPFVPVVKRKYITARVYIMGIK